MRGLLLRKVVGVESCDEMGYDCGLVILGAGTDRRSLETPFGPFSLLLQ